MWTRKELKEKGKTSFKANYWKAVLVGLIFSLIAGGGFSANFSNPFGNRHVDNISDQIEDAADEAMDSLDEAAEEASDAIEVRIDDPSQLSEELGKVADDIAASSSDAKTAIGIAALLIGGFIFFIVLFAIAIGLLISAFLLNPIEMGCDRFFVKNLEEPAEIAKNVLFAFDNNYKNVVKTLFFRDLYLILWSMLFVIPGIVKAYEYRMIPYLLAEHPEMSKDEAFAKSKAMMTGNKWKAFVLDLSFIGWELLSILTCGILSIFYVTPYQNATKAALYDALKEKEVPMIEAEA